MIRIFTLFALTLCLGLSFPLAVQAKDSFHFMKDDGEFSAEEKDEEAQFIYDRCEENALQSVYYRCECIAGAFRAARDDGPLMPQATLLYSLFEEKGKECINKPAIAGEAYNFCDQHTKTFRARAPDNEAYCECVARQTVRDFSRDPQLRTHFISNIHVRAMSRCRPRS